MPSPHWRQPWVLRSNPAAVVSLHRAEQHGVADDQRRAALVALVRRRGGPGCRRSRRGPRARWTRAGRRGRRRGPGSAVSCRRETLPFAPAAAMVFPSIEFAVFFPPVLALSWALMPRPRLWKPFILAAQLRLLRGGEPEVLPAAGRASRSATRPAATLDRPHATTRAPQARIVGDRGRARPARPRASSSTTASSPRTSNDLLDSVGLGLPLPLLTIALPVGLSFFTFQAISYTVDVYRGLCERAQDDRRRALPELLPAPRRRPDRPRARVPAAARRRRATRADVAVGTGVFLIGARAWSRRSSSPTSWRATSSTRCSRCPRPTARPTCWLAIYGYAAQIYCDFSGYTDIAIGLALLMGFVFPRNFDSPVLARRASATSGGAGT